MKKLTLLLVLSLLALMAIPANADTIVLTPVQPHTYDQGTNNPCIFGYSAGTCGNSNPYGYNNKTPGSDTGSNPSAYTLTTEYTVAQLQQLLGGADQFKLGYDVNQAGNKADDVQILGAFSIDVVGGANLYSLPGPTSLPLVANGTGFADYLMTTTNGGFFSLNGLDPNAEIRFTYKMNLANDGGEQVWLISNKTPDPVPEPASMTLLGIGLLGGGVVRRLRKKA